MNHGVARNLSDMWRPTVEIGAAQIRCLTEITLKSQFLFVSRRHQKLSCIIVWTATALNWNKSFTHIEHRTGAVGRGLIIGNLSTRRSWFTNDMAGREELDWGRDLCAKCKSLSKTTWNHHERRQNDSFEMPFKDLHYVLFLSYEENMISDEEFLLLYDKNTLRITQNLNLWFQPENSRFEVRDHSSRTSWHAQWLSCCKNTSGWGRGSKNVWCLSSLTRTNQHSVAEIILMQTFYKQRLTSIDCGFTLQGMSGRLDKGGHEAKFDTMLL